MYEYINDTSAININEIIFRIVLCYTFELSLLHLVFENFIHIYIFKHVFRKTYLPYKMYFHIKKISLNDKTF